jgi:hypothetical protein
MEAVPMSMKTLGDGRIEFVVHGLGFLQNSKSPELFSFVASSNELLQFCGVARKSQDLLTNYQRALDPERVEREITPFFRIPDNCSPTAIVISLQQTNVCEIAFADTGISPLDPGIHLKTLTLTFKDASVLPRETVIGLARAFLDERLGSDPTASVDSALQSEEEVDTDQANGKEADTPEDEVADGEDEEGEDEEAVEIGHSVLRTLRDRLDSPESLSEEMVKSLREMLKPALIIDGQHRLYGAAGVEEDIPVLVCAMITPTWKEQVFQFIVVNDKATGIPKPFITSLAGMSLTGTELDELRNRLAQANVKLWEVEVMQRLGYDSASPFYKMIEFKVAGADKGLGYQTMKRVGKAWYSPSSSGLYKLMRALYRGQGTGKTTKKALKEKWQSSGNWFDFLCLYWSKLKEKFQGTAAWQPGGNLLTAVVLEMLQADFLKVLDAQATTFWDISAAGPDGPAALNKRIGGLIDDAIHKFKSEHFAREWKRKSLNHKDGRADLADLFRKIREGESTTNHVIYTGKAG